MKLKRLTVNGATWAFLGLIVNSLSVVPTLADVVYTYSGLDFANFTDVPLPSGSFDATMSVTGSFTLSTALPPNLPSQDISGQVLRFSFSDGRSTVTNIQAPNAAFFVSTGALGNISSWNISMSDFGSMVAVGDQAAGILTISDTFPGDTDQGYLYECLEVQNGHCIVSGVDTAAQLKDGTWSVSTVSSVPLPATLPLFATGLGALGLLGWRRKKRAAPSA
jgi:PEP-CTERM motif-containing protein